MALIRMLWQRLDYKLRSLFAFFKESRRPAKVHRSGVKHQGEVSRISTDNTTVARRSRLKGRSQVQHTIALLTIIQSGSQRFDTCSPWIISTVMLPFLLPSLPLELKFQRPAIRALPSERARRGPSGCGFEHQPVNWRVLRIDHICKLFLRLWILTCILYTHIGYRHYAHTEYTFLPPQDATTVIATCFQLAPWPAGLNVNE